MDAFRNTRYELKIYVAYKNSNIDNRSEGRIIFDNREKLEWNIDSLVSRFLSLLKYCNKPRRMDFESPDVEKEFPGLYASESAKKSNESDCTYYQ